MTLSTIDDSRSGTPPQATPYVPSPRATVTWRVEMTQRRPLLVLSALLFSLSIPCVGYLKLGALVALLFAVGYLGGFVLWLCFRTDATWAAVRGPYWTGLAIFVLLHKVEENRFKFFEVLGEKITGVPVPEVTPLLVVGLLVMPIGAWLSVPYLVRRRHPFGTFLAWTLFASFGIVEAAHFIFPLLADQPCGYFPGMASAALLVPAGWWGMSRLAAFQPRRH
jgi:hypothetical protein